VEALHPFLFLLPEVKPFRSISVVAERSVQPRRQRYRPPTSPWPVRQAFNGHSFKPRLADGFCGAELCHGPHCSLTVSSSFPHRLPLTCE
jgi:hypothetical protein